MKPWLWMFSIGDLESLYKNIQKPFILASWHAGKEAVDPSFFCWWKKSLYIIFINYQLINWCRISSCNSRYPLFSSTFSVGTFIERRNSDVTVHVGLDRLGADPAASSRGRRGSEGAVSPASAASGRTVCLLSDDILDDVHENKIVVTITYITYVVHKRLNSCSCINSSERKSLLKLM